MWNDQGGGARCQRYCQQKAEKTVHDILLMLGGVRAKKLLELRRWLGRFTEAELIWCADRPL